MSVLVQVILPKRSTPINLEQLNKVESILKGRVIVIGETDKVTVVTVEGLGQNAVILLNSESQLSFRKRGAYRIIIQDIWREIQVTLPQFAELPVSVFVFGEQMTHTPLSMDL
jgi:hypothetical protein